MMAKEFIGPIGVSAAIFGISVWAMVEMGLSPMEMAKAFGHGLLQLIGILIRW
jgi:hypothetical protein